jgi:pilus assembly protein Flp/PilA
MVSVVPALRRLAARFAASDSGAQVVEYALIIAVVSLALIVLLSGLTGTGFSAWIDRVTNCLTGSCS